MLFLLPIGYSKSSYTRSPFTSIPDHHRFKRRDVSKELEIKIK